jgi:hypothetical protein
VRRMHLSPAMGVALAALAVAASGTVYASASNSSENVIVCVRHKGGGLYVAPKCARHDRHIALDVAGSQDTAVAPTATLFAQVESNGTINASSPGVTVSQRSTRTGTDMIDFGQDISHCAATATQGALPFFGIPGASTPRVVGSAIVDMFAPGYTFPNGYPSADTVQVETFDRTMHAKTSFYIVVSC